MPKLGVVMRRLRKHKGLRLCDVAQEVGLSITFVSDIERGVRMPDYDRLAAIAALLGTTPEYLAILRARQELPSYLANHPDIVRLEEKLRRKHA